MNEIQKQLIKNAMAHTENLDQWEIDFMDNLTYWQDDHALSKKQNAVLNIIATNYTPAPEEFIITTELLQWAKDNEICVDEKYLNHHTGKFLDYHLLKETHYKYKDWGVAWRVWMRNAKEFSKTQQPEEGKLVL